MTFLGIDQHAHKLTVSLRDQQGDVLLARQGSIRLEKILDFFDQLTERCAQSKEQFIAVVEVCGFNDWLIRMLALISSVTDRGLAQYVEFLKEENEILRSRVPGQIHTKPH